ncbi:uncharacterized protein PAC_15497 [Phialocephala subalpina]|uniref:Uncharacterized protein n=1 Tax=Phialocephala subalpina TaxID=576137 RepID=A0A1L7XKY9_9HELO|nr:uncharacterized protein PAC_15497 [Phialocephala subalpina]
MSDQNQQPPFALSESADGARKHDQRARNSGTLDRYIYDTDNVGDLVNGETTEKVKRIAKAVKTITKFAESFGKER